MENIFDFRGIKESEQTIKKHGVSSENVWQMGCFPMMRLKRLRKSPF